MIRLIAGDNGSAISKRLQEIESTYDVVTRIDARKECVATIFQAAISEGLFSEKKVLVISNAEKITAIKETELAALFKTIQNQVCDIILVSATVRKSPQFAAQTVVAESLFLPKYFFMFLDGLVPGNSRRALELYSKIPQSVDSQLIFYSMVKRTWQMLGVRPATDQNETSFLGMSPWQASKVASQASKWDTSRLQAFYQSLFEIEKDIKTSGDALPLSKRLDIAVLTGLN